VKESKEARAEKAEAERDALKATVERQIKALQCVDAYNNERRGLCDSCHSVIDAALAPQGEGKPTLYFVRHGHDGPISMDREQRGTTGFDGRGRRAGEDLGGYFMCYQPWDRRMSTRRGGRGM